MATNVGMMSSILGMKRVVNSTRACTDMPPRIGPMINPRKRSMLVQRPPPPTWKKVSAHNEFVEMATISPTRRTATIGSPRTGTIENGGIAGGPGTWSGGPTPVPVPESMSRASPESVNTVSVMEPPT